MFNWKQVESQPDKLNSTLEILPAAIWIPNHSVWMEISPRKKGWKKNWRRKTWRKNWISAMKPFHESNVENSHPEYRQTGRAGWNFRLRDRRTVDERGIEIGGSCPTSSGIVRTIIRTGQGASDEHRDRPCGKTSQRRRQKLMVRDRRQAKKGPGSFFPRVPLLRWISFR